VLRSLRPRFLVPALVFLLVVVSLGLVVLSPFALDRFGMSEAWGRRSEIGQTYGAAAALVSVLALAGISVSLVLQAREAKIAREYTSRAVHSELMRMAMDDPAYRECWGPFGASGDEVALRQHMYVNLIVSYWQSRYELGMFSDAHLRVGASAMFAAMPGRRFWSAAREARLAVSDTRRLRRFHRILDEEYRKAEAAGPPEPPAVAPAEPPAAPPVAPPVARPEGLRGRLAALLRGLARRIES